MGCRKCGGQPAVPYKRKGFPTITAWGPFPDHCEVPYTEPDFAAQLMAAMLETIPDGTPTYPGSAPSW